MACIPIEYTNDGYPNCANGEDEFNVTTESSLAINNFDDLFGRLLYYYDNYNNYNIILII